MHVQINKIKNTDIMVFMWTFKFNRNTEIHDN